MSEQAEKTLANDVGGFTHDPYGFVLYAFPWGEGELSSFSGPDKWQIEVLNEIGNKLKNGAGLNEAVGNAIRTAYASGHGIGKSAVVSWIMLWAMSTCVDCKGVVTANTEKQLITKTWAELAKWYRLCICKHWFKLTATALMSATEKHARTWRIDMIPWSENNTEAFAGLHNKGKRILVIYDEGSAIPDSIWEVTEGALTDEDTEIIWCVFGNPTRNTGRFRECFRRYRHRWHTKQIDSRTAAMTNKKQLQEWVDDYGEDSDFVKIRVRGMFPSVSAKQFISVSDVDAAFGRELNQSQYNFAPVILTCDPAWQGDDELVIAMRQGLMFKVLRTIPKNDNDFQIATILAQYEDEFRADAVFIDGGYGTGIYSAGQTMGRSWTLVWFSDKSATLGYLNKRAEMWGLMRDWLKAGGAIPKDDVLYHDLTGPETVPRPDGVIQLESKQDMKRRGIPSPNRADSLALSFAMPVSRRGGMSRKEAVKKRRDYTPFR